MKKRNGTKKQSADVARSASGAPGRGATIDIATVRELAELTVELGLSEVEVDPSGRIRIARGGRGGGASGPATESPMSSPAGSPPPISLAPAAPMQTPAPPGTVINSPFVGTFYRAPSPDAAVFVEVGQTVKKGQVVCIVEAMKLMNEIESEHEGRVAEILVKNGEHVEYGQALIRLIPS